MSEANITAENVSRNKIKEIFDAAFMESSFDEDGDIKVIERCKCFVRVDKERRRINLLTLFGFKSGVSEFEKLQCANMINSSYIMARASVKGDVLAFTYDICLDGGVSASQVVKTVKRFCSIPHEAVNDYGRDIVK